MKNFVILLLKVFTYIVILLTIYWTYDLLKVKSEQNTINMHDSIYENCDFINLKIESMGNVFDVFFVKNASSKAINPHYPCIHIKPTNIENDSQFKWIQIVYVSGSTKIFSDAFKYITNRNKIDIYLDTLANCFPFYPVKVPSDFYDAPLWGYNLNNWKNFFKPSISSWQAHTYLFKLKEGSNTLICLGGIGWGFKFAWYWLYPISIHPFRLCNNLWQTDKQILKDFFYSKGYEFSLK